MDRPNAEPAAGPAPDRDSASGGAANKRLRIVTRCGTLDEFFATFGPFADESSVFIVTNKPRPLGLRQPFVIQLREGETIMRGDVEVIASITDNSGPDRRNGMRLKLVQIDDATRELHQKLLAHARAKRAAPSQTDRPPDSVAVASEARPGLLTDGSVVTVLPSDASVVRELPKAPPGAPNGASTMAPPALDARPNPPSPSSPDAGERVPGSSYQLPANPFEGVTAEALESFVECTLYEERVPRAGDADSSLNDAPPPSRSGRALADGAPISMRGEAIAASLAAPAEPPAFGAPPIAPGGAAPTFGAPPPVAIPGYVPPPPPVSEAIAGVPPKRSRLIAGLALTAVVSSIASLVGAYLMWGRGPSESPSGSAASAATSAAPPVASTAEPVASAAPSASASASAAPGAATSIPPLKRECKANVRSYPQGAAVTWNNEALGTTPLADAPVPCGPAKVIFELAGYERGERSAGAVMGKTGGVFLRLSPVLVPVDVTSTPPGAQVLVDGHSMGRTPLSLSMVGVRESTVTLKLPGYKVWNQKVQPQGPKATVHGDLEKK